MAHVVLSVTTILPSGLPCSILDHALPLLQSRTLACRRGLLLLQLPRCFSPQKLCCLVLWRLHTGSKPAKHSADVVPPLLTWGCLLQSQEPNQQEIAQKEQLIASLNRLVQPGLGDYTGMHVEPYGSFTSGLSNQGGDLDLAVEGMRAGRG